MTYDEMPAGRKMDRLIAEKVMGFKVIETDDHNGVDRLWLSKDGRRPHKGLPLPPSSTDTMEALSVANTVRERFDGHFTLLAFTTNWRAGFRTPDEMDTNWDTPTGYYRDYAAAPTIPLAICRAALMAAEPPQQGSETAWKPLP